MASETKPFTFGGLDVGIRDWCGILFYVCPVCDWTHQGPDTLKMRLHLREKHIDAFIQERREALRPLATLYDSDGKLITQMPAPAGVVTPEMVEALLHDAGPEISEDFQFHTQENE